MRIALALLMLLVMVMLSSRLNLNFLQIYRSSNVSIKRMEFVPKNLVPSQHSRHLKPYKTAARFIRRLGFLNVEK